MTRSRSERLLLLAACTVLAAGVASALIRLAGPQWLGGPTAAVIVVGESMEPALHAGDLVIVRRSSSYQAGDVIAYRVPIDGDGRQANVIHRVTGGDGEAGYVTRGDNRDTVDAWRPTPAEVIGERWFHVPWAGTAVYAMRSALGLAAVMALATFATVVGWQPRRRRGSIRLPGRPRPVVP